MGRELSLTPRAVALLPLLERGLGELQAALAGEPAFEPAKARRTFTIGASDYLQALIIGPLLRHLARRASGIDLQVVVYPNLLELAEKGSVDLAVSIPFPEGRTLSHEPLFEEDFLCMVRRGHPRIRKAPTLPQYLAERHVVVAPGGTPGSLVDDVLRERGLSRRSALRVTNFLVAPVVVAETDFINTMPGRLARHVARTYALRVFPPPLPLPRFSYGMYWHPRLDHDPAQHWLREVVARVSKAV